MVRKFSAGFILASVVVLSFVSSAYALTNNSTLADWAAASPQDRQRYAAAVAPGINRGHPELNANFLVTCIGGYTVYPAMSQTSIYEMATSCVAMQLDPKAR